MTRRIGIQISAEDDATPKIGKTTEAVNGLADSLRRLEKKASQKSPIAQLGKGLNIGSLNQSAEVAKKAWIVVAGSIGAAVRAALEYRSLSDSARVDIGRFGTEATLTAARLGDQLVPAIAGLASAFRPLMAQFRSWLEVNGKVIQSGILEFSIDLARALTSATATGAEIAIKSFRGLKMAIAETSSLYHSLIAAAQRFASTKINPVAGRGLRDSAAEHEAEAERLSGAAAAELGKMTSEIGAVQGLTDKIGGALTAARGLGAQYIENAKTGTAAIEQQAQAVKEATQRAVQLEREANAAQLAFIREGTMRASDERQRAAAKEIALLEQRADAHERAAALIQAQEDRIYSAAGDGISGLVSAWDLFLRTRHQNTEAANAEILDSLASATQQAASTILSTISGLISSFRAELARVGDIETETTQRIAIVAQETQDAYGRKVGERVERYVDQVSGEQMRALEAMGKKAEIVTETIQIKTVTAGEAVANALKSLVGSLGQIALEEIAKYLIGLGIKKLAEKTAAVSSITTAAAEGGAKAAANYAAIPFVGPPLALAAGTAMSAAIMGFTGLIPFAEGGVVTGGVPGRDSVPALLMPGERVLTVGENAAYEAGARAAGRPVAQREPAPPPAARAAAPMRSAVQQSFFAFTTSRAQLDRLERDVFEPGRRRRARNGARREG